MQMLDTNEFDQTCFYARIKFLPEAVVPKAINKDEHGILILSSFKSSRQMIENGNLNSMKKIHVCCKQTEK